MARQRHHDTGLPRGVPESVSRSLWRAAAWTGAGAAAAGAVLGAGVAVLCWLPDAGVAGHPFSAVRAGLLGFLAAQRGGLTVDGVPTRFVPLLAMLVVVVIAWRAGSTLGEVVALRRESRRRMVVLAGLTQAGSYALACMVLVPISALGSTTAQAVPVGVAAFALFGCVGLTSLARSTLGLWDALPGHVRVGLRAAAGAVAIYLASGAALLAGSLAVHADRVMDLSRETGGGLSGLPIAVIGALCTPNAAVASAAYLAGPGFAVGAGTEVNAFSTDHGVLPAFPLLGALPNGHGANLIVAAWMLATVALAGLVAFRLAGRDDTLRALAVAAPAAGAAMALLAWLGGGAVGTGRLRTIGVSPWQVGLAVAGEVATLALMLVAATALWQRAGGIDLGNRRAEDIVEELATVGATDDD